MSYSFSFRSVTKDAAKAEVTSRMDAVVVQMPIHAKDRDPTVAAAHAFIDALGDEAGKVVAVSLSGSCWGNTVDGVVSLQGAGTSVSVSLGVAD